jgi:hypothetical protein
MGETAKSVGELVRGLARRHGTKVGLGSEAEAADAASLLTMPRPRDHAPDEDTARIRRKNASLFIPVRTITVRNAPTIEVASLSALVHVAKKYETVILEVATAAGWEYLLWDDGAFFRFRAQSGLGDGSEPPTPASPLDSLRGTGGALP